MIASLVATIDRVDFERGQAAQRISARAEFEIGTANLNKLPLTVEAGDSESLETATRWLLTLDGVINVDVLFVHYES